MSRNHPSKRMDPSGYLFILPQWAFALAFFVFSLIFLVRTSLYRVDVTFMNAQYVGAKNYILTLTDPVYFRAVLNNLVFAAGRIAFAMTLGFLLSTMLSFRIPLRQAIRTVLFIPMMLSAALVAVFIKGVFQARSGTLNELLTWIGLGGLTRPWLVETVPAYLIVMFSGVWAIGLPMLYYTAGLSIISSEVLESALIDGAGFWTIVWRIIFPSVRPTHITVVLTMVLGSFRGFEQVQLLTNGGPGDATQIVGTYIYRWFATTDQNMGYASAMSAVTFVIAIVLGAVQVRLYQRGARG